MALPVVESARADVRPAAAIVPTGVRHVVKPGQTLWRIATTYGLTVDEVARANEIGDPSRIEVGDRLFIPGATTVVDVPAFRPEKSTATDWIWPVSGGGILSPFGANRRSHRHTGVDIRGKRGDRVRAVDDGVVVYSGSSMRGYGKTVILDHGRGVSTLYAHNSSLGVKQGQRVRQGQTIARVGRSGNASTEHCHFEVRRGDVAVDPLRFVSPGSGISEAGR